MSNKQSVSRNTSAHVDTIATPATTPAPAGAGMTPDELAAFQAWKAAQAQAKMPVTLVNAMLTDANGNPLAQMVATSKNFSSGSRGFYANGKIEINGKRYQASVMLVEIGSKPTA